MHCKMRKNHIAFTAYKRLSGFCHVIKHVTKDSKIKIGRGEGLIAQASDYRNHRARDHSNEQCQNQCGFFAKIQEIDQLLVAANKIDPKHCVHPYNRKGKQGEIGISQIIQQPKSNTNTPCSQEEPRIAIPLSYKQRNERIDHKEPCYNRYKLISRDRSLHIGKIKESYITD